MIEGLPVLTAESAIGINLPKSTVSHARQTDIADETKIYDQIASQNIAHLDQTIVTLFGTRLTDSVKQRKSLGKFPSPLNLWVQQMLSGSLISILRS